MKVEQFFYENLVFCHEEFALFKSTHGDSDSQNVKMIVVIILTPTSISIKNTHYSIVVSRPNGFAAPLAIQ